MTQRSVALSAILITALIFISPDIHAASRAGQFEFSPFIGYTWFDDDLHIDDEYTFGARFGYFYNENWEVEAAIHLTPSEHDSGSEADVMTTQLDILYNFDYGKLVPYLAGGVGYADFDGDGEFVANAGGGARYFFTDQVALRGDLRETHVFDDSDWNFMASLGLSFFFGDKAKEVEEVKEEPQPTDTDGDGVTDDRDKCPGTPKGVRIDGNGCRIDSDGDGVFDEQDKCPTTPRGSKVDRNGCRIDSDGDGVFDEQDKCPTTPRGSKVDRNGCRIDSDGDGVFDEQDKCPGTPKGVRIDGNGCRIDSDGDGVFDEQDKCPGTPKGVKVDGNGCRIDSDGDGVFDEDDQCKSTPRGVPVDRVGCNIKKVTIELKAEFDTDKADIRPESLKEIDRAGNFLVKYTATTGVIEGHTDSQGSSEYNKNLSQRRAEAVRDYLLEKFRIDPARLTAKGYGEDKPIATNDTPEGRQQNRRIQAVFTTQIKQ